MRARLVWNMCVGSHDLCIWRLRNLALGTGGCARVAFFTLGARVLITPPLSFCVVPSAETVTLSSFSFLRFAPMALSFFAVSNLKRICRVAFLRRAVTVGVLSSTI